MDKETDRKLNDFTKKLFGDVPQEVPSFDFTTRVMSEVEVLVKTKQIRHKPLISKKLWILTALAFIGVFSYLIFGNVDTEIYLGSYLDFVSLPKWKPLAFPNVEISKVLFYGILAFTFFVGVQIFLLKHHFNKRFA